MRVAVDMISAGSGFGPSTGGMIVYYSGLLKALCELPSVSEIIAVVSPWNAGMGLVDHPKVPQAPCVGLPHSRLGRVAYEQMVLPIVLKRLRPDVLLSTCNVKPLLWRGPSVVVLQSLQYLHFPEQFGGLRSAYLKRAVYASVQAADAVITVSDWERDEAIRLFGLDPNRVVTVHHGVSDALRAAYARRETLARPALAGAVPYVLMVSSLYGFKNHDRLVRAFAEVVRRHNVPHRLVLAGGDADVMAADLAQLAETMGVGDRVVLPGGVPHADVPALIAHADAVAYVSLYETFGHPVIEALAYGRPLVTSSHGATAEVAGGAARLVDATSVDSIAEGMAAVILDEALREELSSAGPLRAAGFTWEACGEKTAAVLKDVIVRQSRPALIPSLRLPRRRSGGPDDG